MEEKKEGKQQTFDFVGGVKGKLSKVVNHKSRVELQITAPVLLLLLLLHGDGTDFPLHPPPRLLRPEEKRNSAFTTCYREL